jgi:predicted GNAT superfamily acetyltransferase
LTDKEVEVGRATDTDIAGILELQAANQAETGGGLSASLPGLRIVAMMSTMPLVVARRKGRVIGFLMTGTRAIHADVPIIRAMLDAYPGTDTAYIYGPVCVDMKERGRGLAQSMFEELRRLLPGREGILFIRRDNTASFAAHEKMGMREVASLEFNGADYAVFSYFG